MNDFFLKKAKPESLPEKVQVRKKTSIFEFIKDLTETKQYILNSENERDLNIYLLNRFLSADIRFIFLVNEMLDKPGLSKKAVYDFYFHMIKKTKNVNLRYLKQQEDVDVDLLSVHYKYSKLKAKQVLKLHSKESLDSIRQLYNEGGTK